MQIFTYAFIFFLLIDATMTVNYKYHNAPFHFQSGINMAAYCSPTAFLFTFHLITVLRQTERENTVVRTSAYTI